MNLAVLGAGAWGTALAARAALRHPTVLWARDATQADVKPTPETWQLVAEACGAASWEELLAEHDAARQSIAELWNSIKQEASA